jgi:hypothetical protein
MPKSFLVDIMPWIQTKCIPKKSSASAVRRPQTPGLLKQPLLACSNWDVQWAHFVALIGIVERR